MNKETIFLSFSIDLFYRRGCREKNEGRYESQSATMYIIPNSNIIGIHISQPLQMSLLFLQNIPNSFVTERTSLVAVDPWDYWPRAAAVLAASALHDHEAALQAQARPIRLDSYEKGLEALVLAHLLNDILRCANFLRHGGLTFLKL